MTQNTRIHDRFEYHVEDLNCYYCMYIQRVSKLYKRGCGIELCGFKDIAIDAITSGRIKRKPRWYKCLA